MGWLLSGTYFESCNCDAICPCRRIDGTPGGRSTHGLCLGVLSWLIREGTAARGDHPDSPWSGILYLDERADERQRNALEDIFTGRRGGDAISHFPWAWKASEIVAVRVVAIAVDHTRRRQ